MFDYSNDLVSALNTILPTHYELALTPKTEIPCISWQERNNYTTTESSSNLAYSRITYTIKVWGKDLNELNYYAAEIDKTLRPIGFRRTSSGELYDIHSGLIQKILTFECLAYEHY